MIMPERLQCLEQLSSQRLGMKAVQISKMLLLAGPLAVPEVTREDCQSGPQDIVGKETFLSPSELLPTSFHNAGRFKRCQQC